LTEAHDSPADPAIRIRSRIFEFVEFLTDVLKVDQLDASFPYKVGLHQSCHGQRGLKLAQMSELMAPPFSKPMQLLKLVKGIQFIDLDRQDECCGFGGTFCVAEEAVSVKMGKDRVADHLHHGADVITGADMSCLMHLEGILRRQKSKVRVKHIAEILNSQITA
jgi:L-lactate dehydrogenase complex protein LldE